MVAYPDTSFLFSAYGEDAHTAKANNIFNKNIGNIIYSDFHNLELLNAFKLAVFRTTLSERQYSIMKARINIHVKEENLLKMSFPGDEIFAIATEISENLTVKLGIRSLDLLHLAAAKYYKAKSFLTFDDRQLAAAKKLGFKINS